jgi:hypothetical protein
MLLIWMIGVAGTFSVGNGIHLLLVTAIIATLASMVGRRRTL